ncbi:MAG: c-type cytochrome domain-containing protein [Chitinophagaceae bacterium]
MILLSFFSFVGRFHPVLVHLPIGILLLACLFQWMIRKQRFAVLRPAIPVTIFWGMLAAALSCISGFLLSQSGDYDTILVSRHQWLGISVFAVSLLIYLLYKYSTNEKMIRWMSVLLLGLIMITGHLGGSLTHGSDYLSQGWNSKEEAKGPAIKPIANVQEALVYNDMIQPLLAARCYSCHGPEKMKGKLRLDNPDWIMKGGESGHTIVPGGPGESKLIEGLLLANDNKKHMPPKEKPQLTENEISLLHWWVSTGPEFSKKIKEFAQADDIKLVLLSFQTGAIAGEKSVSVPVKAIRRADEKLLQKIRESGIQVMPVAVNSNYLSVNFVKSSVVNNNVQLLEPLHEQLLSLNLANSAINDSILSSIGKLTGLKKLDLSNTRIRDAGLSNLKSMSQLESLNLVGTRVTATGIMQLKELPNLKNIYLYKSDVSAGDWNSLQKAFPKAILDSGGYIVPTLQSDTTEITAPVKYP